MTKKNSIFKQIFQYAIGEVGLKLISIVGLPIVASLLLVDEFGKTDTAASIISICSILIVMGIDTALKRYYYEKDGNYASFIKFALRFYFSLCAIVLGLLIIFDIVFFWVIKIEFEFGIILLNLTILSSLFAGLKPIFASDLQIKRKSMRLSIINIAEASTILVFSIILLKYVKASAEMRLFIIFVVSVCLFIYYLVNLNKVKRNAEKAIEYKKYIKYSLAYGFPIAINQIAGFALGFIDRFMIISFFGYMETGLYSYAYKIGMVVAIFTSVVSQTMLPEFFESLTSNNIDKVKKLIREFSAYGIEATAVLMLLHKEIVLLLTPAAYVASSYIVYIIFIGYLCIYLYNFYTQIENYFKKTKIITIISSSGAVLNIILNLVLMQFFGYEVAAITTMISFAVIYVAHYVYCKKKLNFNVFAIDRISWLFLMLSFVPLIMEMLKISNTIVYIGKSFILLIMVLLSRAVKTLLDALKVRIKRGKSNKKP